MKNFKHLRMKNATSETQKLNKEINVSTKDYNELMKIKQIMFRLNFLFGGNDFNSVQNEPNYAKK